jgi:hypothetical protein
MVHAALLLLMLEAAKARPRFTISLKRSTQNLKLSTGRRPITPSLPSKADINLCEPYLKNKSEIAPGDRENRYEATGTP